MKARRAFSLVELLAVLGVISILLGLTLPSLSRARDQAVHVRELAVVRNAATMVEAYCASNGGVYPVASENASAAAATWHLALSAVGLIESGDRGIADHWLSQAMVYGPSMMAPGATELPRLARSQPIQASRVRYPSAKGLLCPTKVERVGDGIRPWCVLDDLDDPPIQKPDGAVAFADGSVIRASWYDLRPDPWYVPENQIGVPVISTWFGCNGRDR